MTDTKLSALSTLVAVAEEDLIYVVDDPSGTPASRQTTVANILSARQGELFLPAITGWPSTTNGCAAVTKSEYATNDVDLQHLAFDQTTSEFAQWTHWMPADWDAGTITFKAVWSAAAGTAAQTVEWNLQGRAYADDDAIDQAWGTAVEVSDALIATNDMHYTAESAAVTLAGGPVAGELVQFRVFRDIADTLAADARLFGIRILYNKVQV